MTSDRRTFIIFTKHRRLQRLWQFFFTGWGLIMVAALVAGALFTHQLLWTPISAVNMHDIATNQFKMTGASFAGLDREGNPFKLRAASARQEYDKPNVVFWIQYLVQLHVTSMENRKRPTYRHDLGVTVFRIARLH